MALPPRPRLSLIQRAPIVNGSTSTSSQPQQPSRHSSDPITPTSRVTQVPERLRSLEPADPPVITIENPVFITSDAAQILGLTADRLEKWRQRGKGPDYLRYEEYGYVRYELSALEDFKARHRIRPSREPRRDRRVDQ